MNSDILPPDFTVKSLEEEYTSWRKQVDFDKLIKCLWTPSQVESFWSAANWSENNVRKIPATSPQVTSPLEKSSGNNISVEEIPPARQPLFPPATLVEFGTSFRAPRGEPEKRNRVVQKLCQRIEQIQQIENAENTADEIFTIPASSTLEPGTIYQQAADGIISSEGLTGPSVAGARRSEESQVQKEIENPTFLHEQIVKSWGLT